MHQPTAPLWGGRKTCPREGGDLAEIFRVGARADDSVSLFLVKRACPRAGGDRNREAISTAPQEGGGRAPLAPHPPPVMARECGPPSSHLKRFRGLQTTDGANRLTAYV